MKKYIFHEYDSEQRSQIIQDNAEKVIDNFRFDKHLTPEELDEYREIFAEKHIELDSKKQELADITAVKKAEMKPLGVEISVLQVAIKDRKIEVEDTVYVYHDYDSNMVGYYDYTGELVFSRRMKPEERQTNIHSLRKIM